MNIILFGFKASGKSTLGKQLAESLSLPFVDTDFLCENLFRKRYRHPFSCREIFLKRGEAFFRKLEREVVLSLQGITSTVIAVGGGTLLHLENRKILRKIGLMIYLDIEKELLRERIFRDSLPPFLAGEFPNQKFEKVYAERRALYKKSADKDLREGNLEKLLQLVGDCGK